jgi:hypothetical protein
VHGRWRNLRVLDRWRFGRGSRVTYIEELKDVIRKLHGVESTHRQSVPVKEVFRGKTMWEGVVEVFDLHGHPEANAAYAWTHATDDPEHPKRSVTVLHIPPAVSPVTAVRLAIAQELRANANIEAEA